MKCLLTHKTFIGDRSLLFMHRAVNGCFARKVSEFVTH